MVAGNMATLLDVDLNIPALHEGIVSGAFNKGRDGELVAQVILLLAFDKFAERHAGGVLHSRQLGLDLFLPVIHREPAAIVFQVKACEALHDSSYPNSAGRLLRPSVAFAGGPLDGELDLTHLDANTVRIYMQLGAVEPKERYVCKQVKGDTGKETTPLSFPLQIFGVSSRCLSSSVRASLAAILADKVTWETFISRQVGGENN
eukprot:gene36761-biopygen25784